MLYWEYTFKSADVKTQPNDFTKSDKLGCQANSNSNCTFVQHIETRIDTESRLYGYTVKTLGGEPNKPKICCCFSISSR